MKTNNSSGNKSRNEGNVFFGKSDVKNINRIARLSGFLKRKSDKIKPVFFIMGFYKMITKNLNTYEDWSSVIAILSGKSLSRQAVEERMTTESASIIQLVFKERLNYLLSEKTQFKDMHDIKTLPQTYSYRHFILNMLRPKMNELNNHLKQSHDIYIDLEIDNDLKRKLIETLGSLK